MICSIYLCVFFIVTDIIWIHGSMQGSFVIPWFSGRQLHPKYPTEETNSNGISTTFYVSTFIIFSMPNIPSNLYIFDKSLKIDTDF